MSQGVFFVCGFEIKLVLAKIHWFPNWFEKLENRNYGLKLCCFHFFKERYLFSGSNNIYNTTFQAIFGFISVLKQLKSISVKDLEKHLAFMTKSIQTNTSSNPLKTMYY